MVEHTPDGRYIVVDGRRWRATDPAIPEKLRAELVAELMSARRAMKSDAATARPRVQDAKVALGERGDPWWEEPSEDGRRQRIEAAVRVLLRHRSADTSICPSDVARVVGGERWRDTMDTVRDVTATLADGGVVRVTQRGETVDVRQVKGPVRIVRGPGWPVTGTSEEGTAQT